MNKIAVLYDAGQAVLSTFDLDEVLQRILAIAHDYFHLRNVAIALLDKPSQQLYIRSQIGWDEGQDKIRVPLGQGITGAAALKKQPVYAPDVTQRPTLFLLREIHSFRARHSVDGAGRGGRRSGLSERPRGPF